MGIVEQQTIKGQHRQLNTEQFCPECGAMMMEADRLVEGRALFIWYTCGRVGCDGQWLRKFVKDTKNV